MQAEKAIKLIIENQFVLDCPKMLLTPQLPDSTRKRYTGSGVISQNDAGSLTFKIFGTDGSLLDSFLDKYNSITPGKIIGEEHYYYLLATSLNGRQWEARRIDPDTNSGTAGFTAHGSIIELSHKYQIRTSVDGYFADIYFPGDIDIPCNRTSTVQKFIDEKRVSWSGNRNIAKFEACGFNFELEQGKNFLVFRVQSKSQEINSASIIRFIETLQFVLARSLSWAVLEQFHGQNAKITVRSLKKNDKKLVIGPPIALQQCRDKPNIVWDLFQKYLEHVINFKKESWHPISWWMHKVIESESSSIDVEALIRSVAIEAILKLEFSELKNNDLELQSQIEIITDIIQKQDNITDKFKKRIFGLLGSFKNPRAKDRLHILKKQGFINEMHIEEYGKLRDTSAHGSQFSDISLQEIIDSCNSVLVLFYHLIFTAIEYKGPYTDYSSYNFPLKDFGKDLS